MKPFFLFTLVCLFCYSQASYGQISGQNPLMVTNKNNGYQTGVGKLAVEADEILGRFQMRGWVSDKFYHPGAELKTVIDGPVFADGFAANLFFSTGYPALTHRMVITSQGRVGIGTDLPDFDLHTVGNTHTSGDFFGRIHFDDNGSGDAGPLSYIDEAYFERHSVGGFGVAPASTSTEGGLFTLAAGGSSLDHQLFFAEEGIFHRSDINNAASWTSNWNRILTDADLDGDMDRIAKFSGMGTLINSQLFDDGTNVGIGTTTPTTFLDVVGDTRIDGDIDITQNLAVTGTSHLSDKVTIGTNSMPGDHALYVGGSMIAEEVVVKLEVNWPDYVFSDTHPQPDIYAWEQHIKEHRHLPGLPSAATVEKAGAVDLGATQILLLEKIEELTLITIEQQKQIDQLNQKLEELQNQ